MVKDFKNVKKSIAKLSQAPVQPKKGFGAEQTFLPKIGADLAQFSLKFGAISGNLEEIGIKTQINKLSWEGLTRGYKLSLIDISTEAKY